MAQVLKHLGLSEDPIAFTAKANAPNRPLTARERQKARQAEQRAQLNSVVARSNMLFEQKMREEADAEKVRERATYRRTHRRR